MDMEAAMQELLDKQAVKEVMMTYCRALDRLDEEMLRTVFHPDAVHNHGFQGPSSDPSLPSTPDQPGDFVAYALGVLSTHHRTHHHLGNFMIEIEGNVAWTEAYFTACHRMRKIGDPKASPNAFDTEMDYFVGGRYIDRMEKRDGVWKITHRTGVNDWQRIEPPSSMGLSKVDPSSYGQQGKGDFLYRRKEVYGA